MTVSNRHLPLILSLLLTLISLPLAAQETSKVAVVNMDRLLNAYHETVALRAESEAEKQKLNERNAQRLEPIAKIDAELKELVRLLQGNTLTDEQKLAKRQEGAQKEQILMGLERERQETIETGMRAIRENLVTKMADIRVKVAAGVDEYAKAEGYSYVFDATGQSSNLVPFVLYIRNKTDITEDVLAQLNAKNPTEPAPATTEETPSN